MTVICPTVTANDEHEYREQMERIEPFATRIHLDFMDGVFAPTTSPQLIQAWWPGDKIIDLHIMYQNPSAYLDTVLQLKPSMVIIHAEADGDFTQWADALHSANIKVGVALLADTAAETIKPALEQIDHVLIFSGNLGHFGGIADTSLLAKAQALKHLKSELEIGWDGGINSNNAAILAAGGIDVLNVGGFIQKADDPQAAYQSLVDLVAK